MSGKTYVMKGYSTYTDIPSRQGGYGLGSERLKPIHTPATGFTDFVGSPSKAELLKEYVHAPSKPIGQKYASPNHYEGYEPNHKLNYENSSPPKYHGWDAYKEAHHEASRPMKPSLGHGYTMEESRPVLEGARHIRAGNFSGHDESWQSAGPPMTRHPITTPTNNINEALGFLEESVNHFGRSDIRRIGMLDDLPTRTKPIEPQGRYARPAFVGKPNNYQHYHPDEQTALDSQQVPRRFYGSLVP